MIKARENPTLFLTLTFSEAWQHYRLILANQGCQDTLPSNRPWDAVNYYYERWLNLKRHFLRKPQISGYGTLQEMIERHEFQLRAAIHTHSLLWTQRTIDELIAEDYIRADLPDPILEPELHTLVQQNQIHSCANHSCRLGRRDDEPCRKGFPASLEPRTYHQDGELRYRYKRLKEADRWVVPYCPRILLL